MTTMPHHTTTASHPPVNFSRRHFNWLAKLLALCLVKRQLSIDDIATFSAEFAHALKPTNELFDEDKWHKALTYWVRRYRTMLDK